MCLDSKEAPVHMSLPLCNGMDGHLWFAEDQGNKIGIVSSNTNAIITEITIPTLASGPTRITEDPKNDLWFVESNSNGIGKIGR